MTLPPSSDRDSDPLVNEIVGVSTNRQKGRKDRDGKGNGRKREYWG